MNMEAKIEVVCDNILDVLRDHGRAHPGVLASRCEDRLKRRFGDEDHPLIALSKPSPQDREGWSVFHQALDRLQHRGIIGHIDLSTIYGGKQEYVFLAKWTRRPPQPPSPEEVALKEYLDKHLSRFRRPKMTREDFVAFATNRICLYGGDNTASFIAHFGDELEHVVNRLVTK